MIIAHVYLTEREATDAFRRDAYEVIDKIVVFSKYPKRYILNGDDHWYMGKIAYSKWCKGRTYMLDGKLHHSGYIMQDSEVEE